ncbi:MAG: outer membrane protein assembly factor BamD [Woeseiaceae bacterium]|nr:outer membrane protein assembly factor BamD [Woeseiaceae bacterium]
MTQLRHRIPADVAPSIRERGRYILLLLAFGLLAACGGQEEQEDVELRNLQEAYEKAQDSIARSNYTRGIQIFEAIQARYPFSDLSRQIQLELMYAYYKSGQSERAVEASETFIRENPIHPRVDYALYIQALSYFEGEPGFLEKWFRRDMTRRPPEGVEQSYAVLRRLVERYPASPYAPDAEQRMVYLRDRLAQYENHVADYYLRRGAFVAALNRAKSALEKYNGSPSNKRSLELMASAYDRLGMGELADDTRRVLRENYPDLADNRRR